MSINREPINELSNAILNHAVVVNENQGAMRPAGDFGIKSLVALSLALYDGLWPVAGEPTPVDGFEVVLTDDATNYVRMSDAGIIDVVTAEPTDWPKRDGIFTALYDITTADGAVALVGGAPNINDWRVGASVAAISLGQILSALGIDNWAVTGSGPYQITITKGAYSTILDLT